MNKRIVVLLGTVICIAILALIILLMPRQVTVGFQPGTVNYPMMYAIQAGFFEKEGLKPDVTVFRSANDALDAVLGGSVFIDAVIPIQNIAEIQRKNPGVLGIAAVLISDKEHPLDYLVVPSDSKIVSSKELTGKTIIVFPGSYCEIMTRLALKKIGIEEVTFLKRAPSDMPYALQSGEADAGIFYDPVATMASEQGWGRILEAGFWENNLLPEIVVGGYTYNMEFAKKYPNVARQCFQGLRSAVLDARKNQRQAKKAAVAYLNQFASVLEKIPDSRVELADELDPRLIDITLQLYFDNDLLEQVVDLRPLLMSK